jgi:DNA-dependent RNA polymerase auxiliary subunit epsilon
MLKMLGILAAGLAGGYVAATVTTSAPAEPAAPTPAAAMYFDDSLPVAERLQALELTVAAERDARQVLEEQIMLLLEEIERIDETGPEVLSGEIESLIGERNRANERRETRRANAVARRAGANREARLGLLTGAGFSPGEAAKILDRSSELQWEAMRAQYEARNEGRSFDWAGLESNPNWRLRQELGDADYERYLQAMGQSSAVTIQSVMESSPASRIGLEPGDQVVAYNGTRVFNTGELRALTAGRSAGGDVIIEILRDGNRMQLSIPPGPLGVQVNGARGTIGTWRGN